MRGAGKKGWDNPRSLLGAPGVLGYLSSVNMNVTTDQAIPMQASSYIVRKIIVWNASLSLSVALGGVYTAASKGGSAIVSAASAYSALTGTAKFLDLTLASIAVTDVITVANLYLSLTVAQGAAATARIIVLGDMLS